MINIRSSLADLCLRGAKATWAPPSTEATKAIFQQAHRPPPCLALALAFAYASHPTQEGLARRSA